MTITSVLPPSKNPAAITAKTLRPRRRDILNGMMAWAASLVGMKVAAGIQLPAKPNEVQGLPANCGVNPATSETDSGAARVVCYHTYGPNSEVTTRIELYDVIDSYSKYDDQGRIVQSVRVFRKREPLD